MKYWLIVIVMNFNGEYVGKFQQGPFDSMTACKEVKALTHSPAGDRPIKSVCVSDDHYQGRRQDRNIPFD